MPTGQNSHMDNFSFAASSVEPERPAFAERERFVAEYAELVSQLRTYRKAAEIIFEDSDPAASEWNSGSDLSDMSPVGDAAQSFMSTCHSIEEELSLMGAASEVVSDMSASEIADLAGRRIEEGIDGQTRIADDIITASSDRRAEVHAKLMESWASLCEVVGESEAESALDRAYGEEAEALLSS